MKANIEHIKYLMHKKGITQKNIADSLEISKTTLSYYFTERNKKDIPLNILEGICKILGIEKQEIQLNSEEPSETDKLISELLQLTPKYRKIVSDLIKSLILLQNKENE